MTALSTSLRRVGCSLVCLFCMLSQSGIAADQSDLGSVPASDPEIVITFTKSGGFASTVDTVVGRVTISGGQGQVQSTQPDRSYRRSLTPAEVEQLSPARLRESSHLVPDGDKLDQTPPFPGADIDYLMVDVQPRDGPPFRLRFGLTTADPMALWFIREAKRISEARLPRR